MPSATLAVRLRHGRLPVPEAVRIASALVRFLDAAHADGLAGRGVSADTVRISADGAVVLEGSFRSDRPDHVAPHATEGEDAARARDIRAFGELLWLMVAGRPAGTVEPEWSALPRATPAALRRVLRRCLDRDPRRRLREIADALPDLADAAAEPSPSPAATGRPRWPLVIAALAVAFTLSAAYARSRPAALGPAVSLSLPQAAFHRVSQAAISPDGRRVAYPGAAAPESAPPLFVRALDASAGAEIVGTRGALNPFFAPDGRSIGFFRDRHLWRTDLSDCRAGSERCGGAPSMVCATSELPDATGTWGADGTIVLSRALLAGKPWPGLARVSSAGGEPVALTTLDDGGTERQHSMPVLLPGGRWLAFVVTTATGYRVEALDVRRGERRVAIEDATAPQFSPSGHLLAYRPETSSVVGVPFDPDRGTVEGPMATVLDGVLQGGYGMAGYAVAASAGTLVYSTTTADPVWRRELAWVARDGTAVRAVPDERPWSQPRVSPDGRSIVLRLLGVPNCTLWRYDTARGTLARLATGGDDHGPTWDPSGKRIAFSSGRPGGHARLHTFDLASGTVGPALSEGPVDRRLPSFSPDGQRVAFTVPGAGGEDIWMREADGTEHAFLATASNETAPVFSPDGGWLAYASDLTGRLEVYVRPVEGDAASVQVSAQGGYDPLFTRDGREILFIAGDRRALMRVTMEPGAPSTLGQPERLFASDFTGIAEARPYDVAPDGRLLVARLVSTGELPDRDMHVVLGWSAGLAERAWER
jgi:hypothetical protein